MSNLLAINHNESPFFTTYSVVDSLNADACTLLLFLLLLSSSLIQIINFCLGLKKLFFAIPFHLVSWPTLIP